MPAPQHALTKLPPLAESTALPAVASETTRSMCRIDVRVETRHSGAPVPGAIVTLTGGYVGRADANGRCTLNVNAPWRCDLAVRLPDARHSMHSEPLDIRSGIPRIERTCVIDARIVRGTATDETFTGLAGVCVLTKLGDGEYLRADTSEAGEFELWVPARAGLFLFATRTTYRQAQPVELDPTSEAPVAILLKRVPQVAVRVVDGRGRPASEAEIIYCYSEQGSCRRRADDAGFVQFNHSTHHLVVTAIAAGCRRRTIALGELRQPSDQELRIALEPAVPVEGFVVDEDGVAIEGVGIQFWGDKQALAKELQSGDALIDGRCRSDVRGRFTATSLTPGVDYSLEVDGDNDRRWVWLLSSDTVRADALVLKLVVRCDPRD